MHKYEGATRSYEESGFQQLFAYTTGVFKRDSWVLHCNIDYAIRERKSVTMSEFDRRINIGTEYET